VRIAVVVALALAVLAVGCGFGPAASSVRVASTPDLPTPVAGRPRLDVAEPAGATTRVSWSTGTRAPGDVTVSVDRRAEILFARGPSGSQTAPWILPDRSYVFRLYAGTAAHGRRLATLTIGSATSIDGDVVPLPKARPRVTSEFVDRLLQLVPFAAGAAFALLTVSCVRERRRSA
jgi:hypothetical protein